jgi:hypothetical protein
MSWSVPKLSPSGRILREETKEPLPAGYRCLVCLETDPAVYANCTQGDCYPFPNNETDHPDDPPSGWSKPKPLVSAFDLASRMRRKALSLDWEQDELRDSLLLRARQLEKGDTALVPDEDF